MHAFPPLPRDAADRTYVLGAVRGVLQWLECVPSGEDVDADDTDDWRPTLTIIAPPERVAMAVLADAATGRVIATWPAEGRG
jgi:hypothetical protein